MARRAADHGAGLIRRAIRKNGSAAVMLPAGGSQIEMLAELVRAPGIRWDKVTGFHLDEYVGMPITHAASFRRFVWERILSKLPLPMKAFEYVNAESNPQRECRRLNQIVGSHRIDVSFIGIGENGHIAFNDPPADFATSSPYIVVELDEACRRQQLGEGWFSSLAKVPKRAVSVSPRQIMKSAAIVCTVPDRRKAAAVKRAIEGRVTPQVPASILQRHKDCVLFLDRESSSLLERN